MCDVTFDKALPSITKWYITDFTVRWLFYWIDDVASNIQWQCSTSPHKLFVGSSSRGHCSSADSGFLLLFEHLNATKTWWHNNALYG